jgi:hypothetical protein
LKNPSPYSALASSPEAGVSARTAALSPEGRGIKDWPLSNEERDGKLDGALLLW